MRFLVTFIQILAVMRVGYEYPTSEQFLILFSRAGKIKGGSARDIHTFQSPVYFQKGSGIFSVISSLVRRTLPFLRRVLLPAAANMGRDMAVDYSENRNMKRSAKERGFAAIKGIGEKIVRGGIRKKKRANKSVKKKIKRVKKRHTTCHPPDIFDKY